MMALIIQLLRQGWGPIREQWQEGNLDEIIFARRNQAYGAYELRRNEGWYLLTAMSVVLSGMLSLGWGMTDMARKKAESEQRKQMLKMTLVDFSPPIPPGFCDEIAPPPPPHQPLRCRLGARFVKKVPAPLAEVDDREYEKWIKLMAAVAKADSDTVKIVMPPLDFGNEMESWSGHVCGLYEDEFENKKGWLLEPYEPEPMNLEQVMAKITYPQKLKQLAICANIRFRILIDRDGQYIRHEALRGDSLAFAAVEPLLPQLKFLPNPLGFDVSPRWVELGLQLPYTPPASIPNINTFLYCDREPKALNIKEAISKHSYPTSCRNICYEGSTIIRVLVSEKGKYLDHRVITEVHPLLAKFWSQVVPELKFSPAQYQGEDIAFWVNIPFDCKLIN